MENQLPQPPREAPKKRGPKPIVLNQSSLKSYMNCQRLFGWWRLERLEPATRRAAPEIGTAVHAALAQLHSGAPKEKYLATARESLKKAAGPLASFADIEVRAAQATAEGLLVNYEMHWASTNDLWAPLNQEVEFLVEIQPGWWQYAFGSGLEVRNERGELVEAELLVKPTGVYLRGRADNLSIVRGALYLVDYKTAGRMDARDLMKYEMDVQLTSYIYGISKQLTEESKAEGGAPIKVEGSIIDLLVKTQIPQFARETYERSAEEMKEFELEFVEYASRIRAQIDRVEAGEDWKVVFPKNTEHCFKYGTCPYRDLCLSDTPLRREIYKQRSKDYVDEAEEKLIAEWEKEG